MLCATHQEPKKYLLCTQKNLRVCPPAGLVSAARILVSEQGDYELQVLLKTIEKGKLLGVDAFIHLWEATNSVLVLTLVYTMRSTLVYFIVNRRALRSCRSLLSEWNHLTARGGTNWLVIVAFLRGILMTLCARHARRCAVT